MIGKLSGIIDTIGSDHLILDVQGVGYLIHVSRRALSSVGQKGDPVSVMIDTHVREDAITLYGFLDAAEQQWFRLLYSVQGVGPKAAFSILSVCPSAQLAVAIAAQDKGVLTQADGVGPKLATRILTELKDKTGSVMIAPVLDPGSFRGKEGGGRHVEAGSDYAADAVSALVNLGYGKSEAYAAVMQARQKANDNQRSDIPALIRLALKELSG